MTTKIRILVASALVTASLQSLAGCAGRESKESGGEERHVLELRAGDTSEVDGWSRTDLVVGGSAVWMSPDVAVDDDMVIEVEELGPAPDSRSVRVMLDQEGAARLRRLSTDQLSRAIVVLVDGRPTSAPLVMSPLESGFVITAAHLEQAEWDDFVHRLRHQDDAAAASAE